MSTMKKSNQSGSTTLRQKAEEMFKLEPTGVDAPLSGTEMQKLIHELEVHQIELEMQNEELIRAKKQAVEANENYTELYDFAPSGYFTLSQNGEIIQLNLCGAAMLGRERLSLINRLFIFFISDQSLPVFNHFFDSLINSKTKETCEVALKKTDDVSIYVHLTGIHSFENEKFFITAVDITERKEAEFLLQEKAEIIEVKNEEYKHLNEELRLAKERAEESDHLKSAFLANMSHEIRTPMNGILGFAELLKEPGLTGEQQQFYISIIEKSGDRMLNIINDIICISKVESGQMEITILETDVNKLFEYITDFFKPEAEKKGIYLSFKNYMPGKEVIIHTDREKLLAVLTNLVKNAIKFTPKGLIETGYTIKPVKQSMDDSAGRVIETVELEFFVKDTGIGLLKEQSEFIFERFRQGSELLTSKFEGAGLGLSISKAFVEMLGGKIWVETTSGIGSTFYFTLPLNAVKVVDPCICIENVDDAINEQNHYKLSGLKILIAEDDESSQLIITQLAESVGKELLKAKTGVEAIAYCQNNPDIDMVLMDIKMPEMDGYEATRQIRQFNKDVIIIAQTAFALTGDREKAIEAGCNDYISKPYSRALLTEVMLKHIKTA
jgi:PAS domain S-box-containing protein